MVGLCLLVLAAVLQIISCQGPPNLPPQCRGPPEGVEKPHECCEIPPFFAEEDFADCGFEKFDSSGPRPEHHHGPPDCTKQLCMLKKYNMLKGEEEVDHEAVAAFMDGFAQKNQNFQPAIDVAKAQCLGKELPGPPQVCEANKLVFCVSSNLFMNCPTWKDTDECTTLKEHIEQCKTFFTN